MQKNIKIVGARVNNLKNIDVEIPVNKITSIIGPSGSGKTSLAFHTLFAESKRRFLNSFPTYLKFFSERPTPVDVESIHPVLPVFGLAQINPVMGTRSNISDIMHLGELFQNFFYYYSVELCKKHKVDFIQEVFSNKIKEIFTDKSKNFYLFIEKNDYLDKLQNLPLPSRTIKSKRSKTINDFNIDDELWEVLRFKKEKVSSIDSKLNEILTTDMNVFIFDEECKKLSSYKYRKSSKVCSVESCDEEPTKNLTISHYSSHNALGACPHCGGFGEKLEYDLDKLVNVEKSIDDDGINLLRYKRLVSQKEILVKVLKKNKIPTNVPIKNLKEKFWTILYEGEGNYQGFNAYFKYFERKKYKMHIRIYVRNLQKGVECRECGGSRLKSFTQNTFIDSTLRYSLSDLLKLSILDVYNYFIDIEEKLYFDKNKTQKSYKKILKILKTAVDIGLGHLFLNRKSKTISSGEYQRLLLLKYLSYEGTNSLFVFDEPSLGLSEKELEALFKGFKDLVTLDNTIIMIEHSDYLIKKSDNIIQMGPLAGHLGGEVLYSGVRSKFKFDKTKFNLGPLKITNKEWITVSGAEIYNKKFSDFKLLKGGINLVLGESGSGKTSCLVKVLGNEINQKIYGEYLNLDKGKFKSIKNIDSFKDIIIVDSNLNRYSSRSTVGSMTGIISIVRKHYLDLAISKAQGLKDGHLSANSELGRCPSCEGRGHKIIEMQFLDDIKVECEDCHGRKIKSKYALITDGIQTVHESNTSPIIQVVSRIKLTPKYQRIVAMLEKLNLSYLSLDRQVSSLSGGEIQRIYLLNKLQKDIRDSILIFENISFGLSINELIHLAELLQSLVSQGNTIVLIDQNPIFKKISNHNCAF